MARNPVISQLSGVQFNGISTEEAADIIMNWTHNGQRSTKPNQDGEPPKIQEHEFLEIPRKIHYLDNWGE